jgi:GMP synthase-like glutamine amidotransferase/pimeloyl-ACP methyl ester carboxylesterase
MLVVITGDPVAEVQRERGDFADLFFSWMPQRHKKSRLARHVWRVTEGEDAPNPADFDGIIVSGSPAMVGDGHSWIEEAANFVRDAVNAEVPLLAICFGHQLLCHALGGKVGPNPEGRHMGTVSFAHRLTGDPLFDLLPQTFDAQVSHRDVILDPGPHLEVVGTSPHDPHHMVKAGKKAWGVQFHPEFDADIMRSYLRARRQLFDAERGEGATRGALENVRPTPLATSLLKSFSAICVPDSGPQEKRIIPRKNKKDTRAKGKSGVLSDRTLAKGWRHVDAADVATEKFLPLPDGTRIRVRLFHEEGARGVPLILNDGLGCEGYVWRYIIDQLKAHHPILHWQYRGHGESDVPHDLDTIHVDQMVEDLNWLLDEVGVSEGIFFGHSMGVQVVLEAHRRLAERMRGLVLMCGSYGRPIETWHGPDNPRSRGPLGNRGMRRIFPWLSGAFIHAPQIMQPIWQRLIPTELSYQVAVRFELNPKRVKREDFFPYLKHLGHMDMRVFARLARSLAQHSAEGLLDDIDIPTLIIAGGRDTFTPAWLSETMHRQIRDSEYLFLPDGSHTAPIEHPDLIHDRLRAFFQERFHGADSFDDGP